MASRLAVQALLSASPLSRAETTSSSPKSKPPPRINSNKQPPPSQNHPAAVPTPSSRRRLLATAAAAVACQLLPPPVVSSISVAGTFDLRLTLPEESSEEAEALVRAHARSLVGVRRFIDAGAWRELQAALRSSASNLKQDLYAIIQASPAAERAELRRLYSVLFNSVTSLDYAARDKDEVQVKEHYGNIVSTLDEIFAKIM